MGSAAAAAVAAAAGRPSRAARLLSSLDPPSGPGRAWQSGRRADISWARWRRASISAEGMQPFSLETARKAAQRDVLAADLQCSFFASALQSYKRDSVLRPFPASYVSQDNKDFETLLEDTSMLPNLKELLQSADDRDKRAWSLVSWFLSSKILTLHSIGKTEYVKIQELMGISGTSVPAPDFLFEIVYSGPVDAKFYETKGERDLIYAFHGSRLENFHSILHNGLHCHLNKSSRYGVAAQPLGSYPKLCGIV